MLPTTILIDERPRCVVRPNDTKDLHRFIRNGKGFLLARQPEGRISHRPASDMELSRWREALALHKAWGGEDEAFFGVPLGDEALASENADEQAWAKPAGGV